MITKKCSQCGKDFVLNNGEIAFYKKKRLHLPNRCKECRDANKLKNGNGLKEAERPENETLPKKTGKLSDSKRIHGENNTKNSNKYRREESKLHNQKSLSKEENNQLQNRDNYDTEKYIQLIEQESSDLQAKKRKFTFLAIGIILLIVLGYFGLNYLS